MYNSSVHSVYLETGSFMVLMRFHLTCFDAFYIPTELNSTCRCRYDYNYDSKHLETRSSKVCRYLNIF